MMMIMMMMIMMIIIIIILNNVGLVTDFYKYVYGILSFEILVTTENIPHENFWKYVEFTHQQMHFY